MTGSDNVCYRNKTKDLRDFHPDIKSPNSSPECAGESSQSSSSPQFCRAGLRGGRYRTHTAVDKFWARVTKTDGCWLCNGATANRAGHKHVLADGRCRVYAHRFSYELHHGPIPKGCVVLHTCDVPACVNPDHLKVGTQKDNIHDAIAKGRFAPWLHPNTIAAKHRKHADTVAAEVTPDHSNSLDYQIGGAA